MLDKDYAQIADRAIEVLGGLYPDKWEEVAPILMAETITREKTSARYTDLDILRELGMETGGAILDKLEAVLPARVVQSMQDQGIDLAHSETKKTLQLLVIGGAISQPDYELLLALTNETVPRFPGLRPGEVQNALEWRQDRTI